MERTSRGGGRVWTNLNESHEMRRNGEKFSWDLKVLKIPRGETNPARFLANKCQCCPYLVKTILLILHPSPIYSLDTPNTTLYPSWV